MKVGAPVGVFEVLCEMIFIIRRCLQVITQLNQFVYFLCCIFITKKRKDAVFLSPCLSPLKVGGPLKDGGSATDVQRKGQTVDSTTITILEDPSDEHL